MDFKDTLEYMYALLPMYQRVGNVAFKKDLTNTLRLCQALGNPQNNFKSIHIAGTNGKGSSAHTIASVLQTAGYKTGLYTSPHLKSFTERIRVDGKEVEESFVCEFIPAITGLIEEIRPSFFEVTVAMAFDYFSRQKVDVAVVEVGLGGRFDSTNIITPIVSLITSIGYDHMDMLGETLPEIAFEKAKKKKPAEKALALKKAKEKAAKEKAEREQAAKEKAAKEKAAKEKAAKEKAAQEKARKEQLAQEEAAKAKAAKEKAEREQAEREKAAEEARQRAAAEQALKERFRREQMARLSNLAGKAEDTGTAQKASGPSATYAGKVVAAVRPNIIFPGTVAGNPSAEVEVTTLPTGEILGRKLVRSSGDPDWDTAVLRAIDRTQRLPRDVDGRVPSPMIIAFRPKD